MTRTDTQVGCVNPRCVKHTVSALRRRLGRGSVGGCRRRGYADATAVQTALAGRSVTESTAAATSDAAVLQSAMDIGVLVTNDLALGRRARNVGVA